MLDLEVVGQGATTKIYRDGGTAIKLYVNAPQGEAEREARFQSFARDAGLPVPKVFGVRKVDENSVALEMAYINGKPIMNADMLEGELYSAMCCLVEMQIAVHRVDAAGLPSQSDLLKRKIGESVHIAGAVKERLLVRIEELSTAKTRLCHGDFHPLNVLFDGEKHWIIDWVDATAGNPLADACRTHLLFLQGFAPLANMYLKLFCGEAQVNEQSVLSWLPIVAAARMRENMDDAGREFLNELVMRFCK